MDVRSRQSIVEHLQKEDVQERIVQSIHRGRDEATVTISRAAELFGITENKLRDWEEYGFLNPLRPSGPKGRRLYTPTELDKLAIIRELINVGYPASDIPPILISSGTRSAPPKMCFFLGVTSTTDNMSATFQHNHILKSLPSINASVRHATIFSGVTLSAIACVWPCT